MKNQESFGATDLFMLALTLVWAINFTFVKIALTELSPLAFNGIRMAFASLIPDQKTLRSRIEQAMTKKAKGPGGDPPGS